MSVCHHSIFNDGISKCRIGFQLCRMSVCLSLVHFQWWHFKRHNWISIVQNVCLSVSLWSIFNVGISRVGMQWTGNKSIWIHKSLVCATVNVPSAMATFGPSSQPQLLPPKAPITPVLTSKTNNIIKPELVGVCWS
jgi:hypothetical protein